MMNMGSPEPFGVSLVEGGVNVAIPSLSATAVAFCLFDADGEVELSRHLLPGRTGHVFHGVIPGVAAGARYGLRVHGPWDPGQGQRFNPNKLLVDPWASAIDRPFALASVLFDTGEVPEASDSAAFMPKGIVAPPGEAAPPPVRPRREDEVVYELHVRGFSKLNEELPEEIRGTFAGLAHPASIAYLRSLGVTLVELMPAMAWVDERHLPPLGLTNYWGYNPMAFLAPDPRLAPGGWPEVRAATDALRAAGIGTVLDVVLNHSGESDHLGPTLSLRGLDNAGFYRLWPEDRRLYVNDAGCGNVLAAERPLVVRLMMDALRQWVSVGGMDGFRFDLATVLARRPEGFDPAAPFMATIAQDPMLRDRLLIAEPWDIGPGGYQLGRFPPGWGEWNDRYRDSVRRFWRGDTGLVGEMATRLAGSADLFGRADRAVADSVNFITAHDGFSLADLVSYERKHNDANGEQNRDGTDGNHSWNNGVEGPSEDPLINERRAADARALLATLLLSRGMPMLCMGDEAGRGQGGNNNAYAQDNAQTWMDWARLDAVRLEFTGRLIALRAAHPALTDPRPLTGKARDASGLPDVEWRRPDGEAMQSWDWEDGGRRSLAAALYRPAEEERPASRVFLALNAGQEAMRLVLPQPRGGFHWQFCLDSQAGQATPTPVEGAPILPARAVVLLAEEADTPASRQRGVSTDTLDRLTEAAGIAGEWWDVTGGRHEVSPETKRSILSALHLRAATEGEARDALAGLAERRGGRALPACLPAREGQSLLLPLGGELASVDRPVELLLRDEAGQERRVHVRAGEGEARPWRDATGQWRQRRLVSLPAMPRGRHFLRASEGGDGCWLIVAPPRAYMPDRLEGGARAFGISTQLYSMRRRDGDQGIGDLTTLRHMGRAAAAQGAAVLGLNPLHALHPIDRSRASPYHPSDRLFLEPLYIDLAALPAPLREALPPEAALLGAPGMVNYSAVWSLKRAVLAKAHALFLALPEGEALRSDFTAFQLEQGEALRQFSAFTAIAEARGEADWHEWPQALRRPGPEAFAAFAAEASFNAFLQWLADRQLKEAAAASGLAIGFYRDLAVGCAPDGAEAWRNQGRLLAGHSVGAPPDPFAAEGQIWNLPALDPLRASEEGHAGFAGLLAANMRHAGALRIDHVMAMSRLFLVPDGARGSEGAYLAYPFEEMLAAASLESDRAKCLLVGEDLGTVPAGIGAALQAEGILSYRVLWFERRGEGFVPPGEWPSKAAACVATHDLPTLRGWWEAADIEERATLARDSTNLVAARAERMSEKRNLLDALAQQGLLPPDASPEDALTPTIMAAIHRYVAQTPSLLALVQVEDLVGERVAINLPGTDAERPNWRRRVAVPVEELGEGAMAQAVLAAFHHEGR